MDDLTKLSLADLFYEERKLRRKLSKLRGDLSTIKFAIRDLESELQGFEDEIDKRERR